MSDYTASMDGWFANGELEEIFKGLVAAYARKISGHSPGDWAVSRQDLIRINGISGT
jgi:hypothetical protein